jgi:hypothetical protein
MYQVLLDARRKKNFFRFEAIKMKNYLSRRNEDKRRAVLREAATGKG